MTTNILQVYTDMPIKELACCLCQIGEEGSEADTHERRDYYERLYHTVLAIGRFRFPGEFDEAFDYEVDMLGHPHA